MFKFLCALVLAATFPGEVKLPEKPAVQALAVTNPFTSTFKNQGLHNFLTVDVAYSTPVRLADAPAGPNTFGWEDSFEIDFDGTFMSFTYFPWDVGAYVTRQELRLCGPSNDALRPDWPLDVLNQPSWGPVISWANTLNQGKTLFNLHATPWVTATNLDGCQHLNGPMNIMLWHSEDNSTSPPQKLCKAGNLQTRAVQVIKFGTLDVDNPFLENEYNQLLFFETPVANQGRNLMYAIRTGADLKTWSGPFPIDNMFAGAKLNGPTDDVQPCFRDRRFYFTRDYKTIHVVEASGMKTLISVKPNQTVVHGIGEPTVDRFGNLYFVVVYRTLDAAGKMVFDADIAVMRKKP